MIYNIWSEGFIVMEARDGASCMGKSKGRNFREACKNFMKHHDPKNEYYDSKNNTYWGCKLFDNETDARASFG